MKKLLLSLLILAASAYSQTITGRITYSNGQPVSRVTMTATSSQGPVSTQTDGVGIYSLNLTPGLSWMVTPSKIGEVNGAISSYDAGLVALFVVGTITFTPRQMIVADVSGDGNITSYDAALISRFAAGSPGTGSAGTWMFSPASRSYSSLVMRTFAGQNYAVR